MFMYLNNECLWAHIYLLFKLSCQCQRWCVLACLWRSMSSERRKGTRQVHTYQFLPCRRVVGFQLVTWLSVSTPCGTLIFGWHWTPKRDLTSKELTWNHIAWVTSRLALQGAPHTHPGQPRLVVSDQECIAFWLLDLCSPGRANEHVLISGPVRVTLSIPVNVHFRIGHCMHNTLYAQLIVERELPFCLIIITIKCICPL